VIFIFFSSFNSSRRKVFFLNKINTDTRIAIPNTPNKERKPVYTVCTRFLLQG
jgi:hypothetical protein